MINICTIFFSSFIFLLNVFEFCLSGIELSFIREYQNSKDECYYLWEWLIISCITNAIIPVISYLNLDLFLKKIKLIPFYQICQLIVSIWAAIIYNSIDNTCYKFLNSNASELWIFIIIHYIMFWLNLSVICMYYVILIGLYVHKSKIKSEENNED